MLSKKVWFDQMMILESIYKFSVLTLPESTPREAAIKEAIRNLWYESVQNIPDEIFCAAVANLIRTHQFDTLKPANVVEQCRLILKDVAGDEAEGWKEVRKSLVWCHMKSSDEELMQYYSETTKTIVEELGGFTAISNMTETELTFAQNKFNKRYSEIIEKAVQVKITTGENLLEFKEQKLLEVKK